MPNKINCVVKRSTDNGNSWSNAVNVFDYPGMTAATDPSFILDSTDGTIYLFVNYGEEGVGLNNSSHGFASNTIQVLVKKSTDDGLTWSEPINITGQVKHSSWSAVMASPGHGIQLKDGTLVHSAYYRTGNGSPYSAFIFFSKDHGRTWLKSNTAGKNCSENNIVQLGDGGILMNMRNTEGKGMRTSTRTYDLGNTWEPEVDELKLPDPGCNAGMLRFENNANSITSAIVLFSNAADSKFRKNIEIKLSKDDCKTWSNQKCIYSGYGAISDIAYLHDGTIGVFYEKGVEGDPTRSIMFSKIPLSTLNQ